MIYILFILLMGFLARAAGGGFGANALDDVYIGFITMPINSALEKLGIKFHLPSHVALTWLPELAFSLCLCVPVYFLTQSAIFFILCSGWSYIWMQTGHGVVLPWGKALPPEQIDRRQFLSPLVDWIAKKFKIPALVSIGEGRGYSRRYCRLFMAVKGFLIGLPVLGFILIPLWPLAYEIGARLRGKVDFDPHSLTEILSGFFAAFASIIFMWLVSFLMALT